MNSTLLSALETAYSFSPNVPIQLAPFGEGLIHQTYQITQGDRKWILQGFNQAVFNYPERIDHNLSLLYQEAAIHPLPFKLPLPLKNSKGIGLTLIDGQTYRLFDFVEGKTLQQVENPTQAYLAAKAYGDFAAWGKAIDAGEMQETIPNFHRLDLRFEKLAQVAQTKSGLTSEEQEILDFYLSQKPLVDWYLDQIHELPQRVMHNDTKINNLIFADDFSKVNAVIDLDTLMAGYVYYDFGDLVRTVACTEGESSKDWEKIKVENAKYNALLEGFLEVGNGVFTEEEINSLPFGGLMMTCIMGFRFLADYLNGNIYYTIHYEEQNLHRAKNQMCLLIDLRGELHKISS